MPGAGLRGAGNRFQYVTSLGRGQQIDASYPVSAAGSIYGHQQAAPTTFNVYPTNGPQAQMPPPLTEPLMNSQSYSNQTSPISPHFSSGSSHQMSPMQSMDGVLQQTPQAPQTPMQTTFAPSVFDPNDPMQYNFDTASFNFVNHYGALEFGMLGHMSSGAAETPPSENAAHLNQNNSADYTTPGTMSTDYSGSPVNTQSYLYSQDQNLAEWRNDASPNMRQAGRTQAYNPNGQSQEHAHNRVKQEGPHAYAIGANSSTFTSPSSTSSPQNMMTGFDENSNTVALYPNNVSHLSMQDHPGQPPKPLSTISTPNLKAQGLPARRTRDPSIIYENVKQPYSYTTGFHGLIAFLQKRFSPQKTLRIAKALASIRPSFISCTNKLNREDLIFMEKCFQRTLWEYEDFINACGTPTIVCRRTGEVAAVGKEFSILTGWKKEVLLGKEPNLNVNSGGSSGQANTGASSRGGLNTPRLPEGTRNGGPDEFRAQPVFLAELLDDDSAIDFYEDFAKLAFGDSRGSVTTQCKLLKYKTANDFIAEGDQGLDQGNGTQPYKKQWLSQNGKGGISSEAGTYQLGDSDGKVECSYCWTVKRDMFDIPMLIVMNVSQPVPTSR